eukprot:Nitzschia sp. Nitz4//scaffold278_size24532//3619//4385//NITZ4_008372-RA/size24532-snap-gene-0.44-mRNA-1//1//CDS//3329545366//6701//frame0
MSSDNYWEWTVSDFMSENETFYVYNGTTWDEYSDREAELGILAAVVGFLVLMDMSCEHEWESPPATRRRASSGKACHTGGSIVALLCSSQSHHDVEAPVTPNSATWASMKSLEEEAKGQLRLSNGTLVPNCCAICLGAYHVGEKVVWSSNSECNHAFHERCILDWLIKMQPSTPSCPCCRQAFTDLPVQKEKKITWSGDAFNLGAVRF